MSSDIIELNLGQRNLVKAALGFFDQENPSKKGFIKSLIQKLDDTDTVLSLLEWAIIRDGIGYFLERVESVLPMRDRKSKEAILTKEC